MLTHTSMICVCIVVVMCVCVYVQYDVWAVMVKIIRQVKKDKDGCALRCGTWLSGDFYQEMVVHVYWLSRVRTAVVCPSLSCYSTTADNEWDIWTRWPVCPIRVELPRYSPTQSGSTLSNEVPPLGFYGETRVCVCVNACLCVCVCRAWVLEHGCAWSGSLMGDQATLV